MEYRSYLWQNTLPTPERNQTLRHVQAIQGRLEKAQEQEQEYFVLALNVEEGLILKWLFPTLIQQCSKEAPSEERNQKLGKLGSLRVLVERTLRQTQAL